MTDLSALLSSAALPEKTVELCLRGDLVAQVEDLERQFRDLKTSSQMMSDAGKKRQLAEQIEALRIDMQQSSAVFRLRGLTRRGWQELLAAHPKRDGEDRDQLLGANADTFWTALVRACIIDPAIDAEQWEQLDAVLSSAQFQDLADAAMAVSRRKVDVPFSFASSATLASAETSKPPSA